MFKKISVKVQSVIVMLVLAVSILSTLYAVFSIKVSNDFKNIEITQVKRNISRSKEIYQLILDGYSKKIVDWASWDDTYKFVKDLNRGYIESNLGLNSLESLEVDIISYYDTKKSLVYEVSVDQSNKIADDIANILTINSTIANELDSKGNSSGLVKTSKGLALYSSHLILKSDESGPPNGYIFFIRYLGDWFTDSLSQTLKTPISLVDKRSFKEEGSIIMEDIKLTSYFRLPVKNSSEFLNLKIEMSREIWSQVISTTKYLVTVVAISIVLAVSVNYIFYNKTIVRDLKTLEDEVNRIAKAGGEGSIGSLGSSLETSNLRHNINTLVSLIYKSKTETENKARDVDRINNLMTDREIRMSELKTIINDLKKKII